MICAERELKPYISDSPETSSFPVGNDLGEEELYYFNARWYDPGLGRFITENPVKDGVNWFAYVSNNPLKYVDPTGLEMTMPSLTDFFSFYSSNVDDTLTVTASAASGNEKAQTILKSCERVLMQPQQ